MKTALVLSGGGFKGAFQAGAIKYLDSIGTKYDLIVGTSTGALNGVLTASNKIDDMLSFWESVKKKGPSDIYDEDYCEVKPGLPLKIKNLYNYLLSGGIFSVLTKSGRDKISKKASELNYLTLDGGLKAKLESINIEEVKIPFICNATSLYNGELYSLMPKDFASNDEFRKFVRASANMPIVGKPFDIIRSKNFDMLDVVDGGIRANVPLSEAISYIKNEWGKWRIIVITCQSDRLEPAHPQGFLGVGLRALSDVTLNKIAQDSFKKADIINTLIDASGKTELGGYKKYPITLISPTGIDIGDTLDAGKDIIDSRLKFGFDIAKNIFNK